MYVLCAVDAANPMWLVLVGGRCRWQGHYGSVAPDSVGGWVGGCWLAGVTSVFRTPRCVACCEGWRHAFRGSSPTGLKAGREDHSQLHRHRKGCQCGCCVSGLRLNCCAHALGGAVGSARGVWVVVAVVGPAVPHGGVDSQPGPHYGKRSSTAAICMHDCPLCIVDVARSKSADRLYDCWADVVACGCQMTCTCV